MALARVKTWSSGEVLTASDLNAEFNNLLNNARDLISPLTSSLDMNGLELILDADADTSITADTDDQIDIRIGGADEVVMTATAVSPASSDGNALGTSSLMWSDLFLASGAVVNFNNGDVTVTHSSNTLTFAGASSGYVLDALLNLSGAAAGQIKFPATQNPSADSNTFDDYEEGTWTPAITFVVAGNLAVSYSTQTGVYTKIGRVVFVTIELDTSSFIHTTASGSLSLTGFPFTSANDGAFRIGACVWQGITKANFTDVNIQKGIADTVAQLVASGSAQNATAIAATDTPSAGTVVVRATVSYNV